MQPAVLCGIIFLGCSQLLAGGVVGEEPRKGNGEARQIETLTLRASEILPQQVLSGPNHEVVEFVPVERDRCQFTLRTEWGEFTAIGKPMLELRLREIAAIELVRSTSGTSRSDKIPVVPISSLRIKSSLPNPRGRLLQPQKSVEATIDLPGVATTLQWGTPEIRRTAFEIGCDPETTQPLVYEALETLAKRDDLSELLSTRRGPSPFPTVLLSVAGDQRELLAGKQREELQVHFEQVLAETGVDSEIRQIFCRQLPLTSSQKWLLVRELQVLKQTPGAVLIFSRIVSAPDELAALEILQELRQSNNFQSREPLKEITLTQSGAELHTQRGEIALVHLGDYLTGNPPFQQEIEQFRASHPKESLLIVTPAQISPSALKILQNSKVKVFAK